MLSLIRGKLNGPLNDAVITVDPEQQLEILRNVSKLINDTTEYLISSICNVFFDIPTETLKSLICLKNLQTREEKLHQSSHIFKCL